MIAHLFELAFEFEEESCLVRLKGRPSIIILTSQYCEDGRAILVKDYAWARRCPWMCRGLGLGCCLERRAIVCERVDYLLQGFVVEVVLGPSGDLVGLDLLAELDTQWSTWAGREGRPGPPSSCADVKASEDQLWQLSEGSNMVGDRGRTRPSVRPP